MSETTDQPGGEAATESPDRRSLLKKAGVVGVGIWAAPVVTSLTSPAYANGSPPSGRGCIVLPASSRVTASWNAAACNSLAFGLVGGPQACSSCEDAGSGTYDFGVFPAGTGLTFYFEDNGFGSCCTIGFSCDGRYECGSGTSHVTLEKISDSTYKLYFLDAGCECDRAGQNEGPTAGPGVANIDVTLTITPVP
jgi:hypothetical protein